MAPLGGVAVVQEGVAGLPGAIPRGPLAALMGVGGVPGGTMLPPGGVTVEIAMMIVRAGTSQDYETSRGAGL